MRTADTVVIGGGFAGLFAALVEAEAGKKVTLLAYGSGTFPLNSGLIDVLGYDEQGKSVANPLEGLQQLPASHPYKKIGQETLEKAIAFFLDAMAEEGFPYTGSLDTQRYVITGIGTLKPTCLLPASMDATPVFEAQKIVLVGIKGLKDFYATLALENLEKALPEGKEYETVVFDPHHVGRDLTTRDVARLVGTEAGYQALLTALRPWAGEGKVFLMPQILGATYPTCHARLVKELGCPVVEMTGMPPSVNGLRLRDALLSALRKRGVRLIEKAKVQSATVRGKKAMAIQAGGEVRLQNYPAKKFILATGGFYSGGIEMRDFGAYNEGIFHLPVEGDAAEDKWTNPQLFSNRKQGFALAGIRTDNSLRGVDAKGNLVLENVYVAGRNLSGYDFCFEHSGNGVALASAYRAARS